MINTKFDTEFDEVLSAITHEMKSPIALIKANLELLKLTSNGTVDKSFDMMLRELDSLENMSQNLVNIVKNVGDKEQIFLVDVVENVLESYINTHKDIEFNIVCTDEEISVMGSMFIMEILVNNLIKNAVEAIYQRGVSEGHINVLIVHEYDKVSIEVVDNGIGLEVSDKAKLFDKFYTTKASGSGIGLSIVKYILKEYDGYFALDNNIYGGCTASVVFVR